METELWDATLADADSFCSSMQFFNHFGILQIHFSYTRLGSSCVLGPKLEWALLLSVSLLHPYTTTLSSRLEFRPAFINSISYSKVIVKPGWSCQWMREHPPGFHCLKCKDFSVWKKWQLLPESHFLGCFGSIFIFYASNNLEFSFKKRSGPCNSTTNWDKEPSLQFNMIP